MPLTRSVADAIGVVTICLVSLLILIGFLCIAYSFYFLYRTRNQGFLRLSYFTGPWIIRVTFILVTIWWGLGEIVRLDFLRLEGRVLNSRNLKLQETVCKGYIVSNLGFAEPCLVLTLVFLLRAPLQRMEFGSLNKKWNGKTAGYIILCCLPMVALQLMVILMGPTINHLNSARKLPQYFTMTSFIPIHSENVALCTYPLLSTILHGIFVTVLTVYLFWLGRRILNMVINKGLQKRIYALIFSVPGLLPLRVLLLGLSVLSKPEQALFETLAFMAFLALLCCIGICVCMLVYYPVADSLALGSFQDLETRPRITNHGRNDETVSLIANQSVIAESDRSTKHGSMSFRDMESDETSAQKFVELSLFSPSRHVTPLGSPIRLH